MKIDNILKASLCAFGQNTFDSYSLEEEEFIRALDYFINENDFNSMIEDYAYEFDYDIDDLKKAEQRINCKSKDFDYAEIITCCRLAYVKTIFEDKTIDAEAFIDNIVKEFNKKL